MSEITEHGFAIYEGKPVAVVKFCEKSCDGGRQMVDIRYIQRTMNNKIECVFFEDLSPFTEKVANYLISEYNVRIQAIQECLQYM